MRKVSQPFHNTQAEIARVILVTIRFLGVQQCGPCVLGVPVRVKRGGVGVGVGIVGLGIGGFAGILRRCVVVWR